MKGQDVSGLSQPVIETYRAKGFAVEKGLFSPDETAAWVAECDRLWDLPGIVDETNLRTQSRAHAETGTILDRLDPVTDLSELFLRLAHDERLLGAAESLLGGPARLFKDKLIVKRPGTHGYLLHQDFPYWEQAGIAADELLVVFVSIDRADGENGALELFAGLHHERLPGPAEEPRDVDPSRIDLSRGELAVADPGDVLFMHALAPHRSGANKSERPRRMLIFTYTLAAHGDAYKRYYEDQIAALRAQRRGVFR